jgi:aromatic ring-cleaving dioxygenase
MSVHPNVRSVVNPDIIQHYHAHVYYDPASSRDRAARLRERVAATFPGAILGRWHDTPVGPHTQSMYQIALSRRRGWDSPEGWPMRAPNPR